MVLVGMAAACASSRGRPIAPSTQYEYFRCRGTLDDAENRLADEEWPIGSITKRSITTEWRPINTRHASVYNIRLVVTETRRGLRFSIYQHIARRAVPGIAPGITGEHHWNEINTAQVRDSEGRRQLNWFRRSVCGDREGFFRGNET